MSDSMRYSKTTPNSGPEVSYIQTNEGPFKSQSLLDPNVYATKKTIAQGMLDVALLTANASQLKYCLQLGKRHQFFYLMVSLISTSIVLQIGLGAAIILKSRYNINKDHHHKSADLFNNLIVWIVFIITIIVGAIFVLVGYINFNDENKQKKLNLLNNIATVFVFIITVVNVLIAGFGLNFDETFVSPNLAIPT